VNYKNNKIIYLAIEYGCKTAKDFATFLKRYNPKIITNQDGLETIHFSLLR